MSLEEDAKRLDQYLVSKFWRSNSRGPVKYAGHTVVDGASFWITVLEHPEAIDRLITWSNAEGALDIRDENGVVQRWSSLYDYMMTKNESIRVVTHAKCHYLKSLFEHLVAKTLSVRLSEML